MIAIGERLLDGFDVFDVYDPAEMDAASRVSRRFGGANTTHSYTLRDRALWRRAPRGRLTRLALRRVGDLFPAYVSDRYGTEVRIVGAGPDRFCLTAMLAGAMELHTAAGERVAAGGTRGLIYRGEPGTRFLTDDGNARFNLWVEAGRVERALEALLDEGLTRPLRFEPSLDWSAGFGASLRGVLGLFVSELGRADGLTTSPVALCSFTDLVVHTMLQGLPHTHTGRLRGRVSEAVPRHLRRAEDYMRAHADRPLGMREVAAAAGCSVRSLQGAFRRFRDTTPLAALRRVRLDAVRAECARAGGEAPVMEVARRFGFTNRGRFLAAYAERFGGPPPGVKRRS